MDDDELLARRFEGQRDHLRQVAYQMLRSTDEADDAVQEAWLRLSRSGPGGIDNLGGWLTTVVARVCLDMLRTRAAKGTDPLPAGREELEDPADPETETVLADSIGLAMLVVLDALPPPERVAFVLHDLFSVPFEEIAHLVGRNEPATRKLASRARARVRGAGLPVTDVSRQGAIVAAFLSASRGGDFGALLALLDPEVTLTADEPGPKMGGASRIVGASRVGAVFSGGAKDAEFALVDGVPGLIWVVGGHPRVVFDFTIRDGRITGIDLVADADRIGQLQLSRLHA